MVDFFSELKQELPNIKTRKELERLKKDLSKKHKLKTIPTNADIVEKIGQHPLLTTKPTRSLSGVSVVAIMTQPFECPGKCIYCPTGLAAKSYTGYEPAAMRAIQQDFDAFKQVTNRLSQLHAGNHPTNKIELIFMGGTWNALPLDYQTSFTLNAFNALNGKESKTISEAQKINETANHRCVGLTFETRPDYCSPSDVQRMLSFGGTRVELGVQSLYDDVLKKVSRGHTVQETIDATRLLKDSFFKVCMHVMPGLPFSSQKKDFNMFKELFSNPDFRPDMLKIYPCLLSKREFATKEIYELYESKQWSPLNNEEAIKLLSRVRKFFPAWTRVMRIQRDIPAQYLEAGVTAGNLRELLTTPCKCIRCREVRDSNPVDVKLIRRDYEASNGTEVFLSFEDTSNDLLLGFLRLRLPSENTFLKQITDRSMGVRELHVYGQALELNKKSSKESQHNGYGHQLLAEAERIAKEDFDADKLLVISGVGVRQYYRSLGYNDDKPFVSKSL